MFSTAGAKLLPAHVCLLPPTCRFFPDTNEGIGAVWRAASVVMFALTWACSVLRLSGCPPCAGLLPSSTASGCRWRWHSANSLLSRGFSMDPAKRSGQAHKV
jgi:hypothetical protein